MCKEISDFLLNEHQVYVQSINYPTVPKGTERIRITPTPCPDPESTEKFVDDLKDTWCHFMPQLTHLEKQFPNKLNAV